MCIRDRLYTSEESPGLRSLTLPVPFLTQADDKRLTGCDTVCMAGRLLLTEARAVTGRKLYLRVMPVMRGQMRWASSSSGGSPQSWGWSS